MIFDRKSYHKINKLLQLLIVFINYFIDNKLKLLMTIVSKLTSILSSFLFEIVKISLETGELK